MSDQPAGAGPPVELLDEDLAAVHFDVNGLVPAIVQEQGTGRVLMMAWMDEEALRRTLSTGRTWFWSRSRHEYWCKGETSGNRQWVREAFYDCDGDTLLVVVEQEGSGACHTGAATCFHRAFGRPVAGGSDRGVPMIEPGFQGFCKLARAATIVPVWREVLADTLTPVGAFQSVVGADVGFLLESVEHGERWSRFSFVGRRPLATLLATGTDLKVTAGHVPASVPLGAGVLHCLEGLLAAYRSPEMAGLPPLHGGVVGYLGYDVVREIEELGQPPHDNLGLPDAVLSVIGEIVAFDHWRQRAVLLDNVVVGSDGVGDTDGELAAAYQAAAERLEQLRHDLATRVAEPLGEPPDRAERLPAGEVARTMSSTTYCDAVEVAKEHIRAGDAFQVVLAQRYDVELGAQPIDVYRVLRQVNPSPYMFFLRQGGVTVVGASPEPMVQVLGNRVVSRPIAGTRPRGATEEEDRLLAADLVERPKEVAEHVMLVDLARNDVGRVVRFGTETVDEMMTLERYSHVMHLTSQVSGELLPGKGPIDVLRATLPAGTVSGAPKVRAMEIIDDLEVTKRGPYAGVVGYVDFSGNLDTAITIRTLVVGPDGRASVQAGAGIVADSDPAAEDEECANKAAALLSAVAGARRLAAAREAPPGVAAPAGVERATGVEAPA